jgi:hypothetical protein
MLTELPGSILKRVYSYIFTKLLVKNKIFLTRMANGGSKEMRTAKSADAVQPAPNMKRGRKMKQRDKE